MSVFLLFNNYGQSQPSAIRVSDIAFIGRLPNEDEANPNRASLKRHTSPDSICIYMTREQMISFPAAVDRAVAERPSKGHSREGFIALDERVGPNDSDSRLIITPTQYFNLITPSNADGTGSTIAFITGHTLPEKTPVMDRTSLSVVNQTSDVIKLMRNQGHRFIDLGNGPGA